MIIIKKIFWLIVFFGAGNAQGGDGKNFLDNQNALVESHIACPAQIFSKFIDKFSNDVSTQMAFTEVPLIFQYLDFSKEPEPSPVIEKIGKNKIRFPVMPLHEERIDNLLTINVVHSNLIDAEVLLFKDDTDYKISFFFKKKDCWKLVRIENWSL